MEEADALSDRIAIIDHGKLLQLDTPGNLKKTIGSGDIIEMQLADREKNEVVMADLKAVNGILEIQEINDASGTITIRALNAVSLLPEIIERVDATRTRVSDISIRENTLEDVFIYLTGRGLRE
jgi:ABC-2 type transport system ATP-binding protein